MVPTLVSESASSWAMKHADYSDYSDGPLPTGPEGWIEGSYGTDCDYDFEYLLELIRDLLDEYDSENIANLTFEELKTDLLTDPDFTLWNWSSIHLKHSICVSWWSKHIYGPITESIVDELQNQMRNRG